MVLANSGSGAELGGDKSTWEEQLSKLDEALPVDKEYDSRKELTIAVKTNMIKITGLGVMIDATRGGSKRFVMRCPCAMKKEKGKKAVWKGLSLDGFVCEQKAGEKDSSFARRRMAELECYASTKLCPFKVVAVKSKNSCWSLQIFNGRTFTPHNPDCTALAKVTGSVLRHMMKPAIVSNPSMKGKHRDRALVAREADLNVGMLPSESALYRAQKGVRDEELKYYDLYWARLGRYIADLGKNEGFHTALEMDKDGHFLRYFVGMGLCLKIIKEAGLDHFALDACFSKHVVANGMQYHILAARTGANRRLPLAISLDLTESNATYEYFANEGEKFGLGDVLQLEQGNLSRRAVVVTDGAKGAEKFLEKFQKPEPPKTSPYRARCGRHLSMSNRGWCRKEKKRNSKVNVAFSDNQIYAIVGATTLEEFNSKMRQLEKNFPTAAGYMKRMDPNTYSLYHMAKNEKVACFGHKTNGNVEGLNGDLVELRKLHPYLFLDEQLIQMQRNLQKHRNEISKWKEAGILLAPYATNIYNKEFELARKNAAYRCEPEGENKVVVFDPTSEFQTRHHVNFDPKEPSCEPCSTWCQHKIPCRHMILSLAKMRPLDFNNKEQFALNYFHPAYLVKNLSKAYEDISMKIPDAVLGPEMIVLGKSSEEEEDVEAKEQEEEDVEAKEQEEEEVEAKEQEEEEVEAKEQEVEAKKCKPPRNHMLDTYGNNKKRGRPRTRRITNTGSRFQDGGRVKKRSANARGDDRNGTGDARAHLAAVGGFDVM